MVGRISLGDRPDDREGVEYINDIQYRTDRQGRADQGHGDLEKLLPVVRAVHGSRLVIGGINALQAGEDAERDKRDCDKDTAGNLPCKVGFRRRRPVDGLFNDPETEQQGIQSTVVRVNDELPCAGLDDQCGCPRENHDGPGDLPAPELIVQDQGQYKSQQGGQHHHRHRPDDGILQNQLESGTVHNLGKIGEAGKALDDTRLADVAERHPKDENDGDQNKDRHQDNAG